MEKSCKIKFDRQKKINLTSLLFHCSLRFVFVSLQTHVAYIAGNLVKPGFHDP